MQECESERRKLEDLKHERDVLLKMRSNVRGRVGWGGEVLGRVPRGKGV